MQVNDLKPGMVVGIDPFWRPCPGRNFEVVGITEHYNPANAYLTIRNSFGDRKIFSVPRERDLFTLRPASRLAAIHAKMNRSLHGKIYDHMLSYAKSNVGSDPEFFMTGTDGKILPSWKFLKAKKEANTAYNGMVQLYWDGYQGELAPKQSHCLAYHVDHIHFGLKAAWEKALKVDKNAKFSLQSVMEVPFEELETLEEQYVAFGCNPSQNIYGTKGKEIPNARLLPLRFAGGHIHLELPFTRERIAALDATVGIMGVLAFRNIDNPVRRQFYGQAGEYRTPAHGLEYRVLSNAWLCHPAISHFFLDTARRGVRLAEEKGRYLLAFYGYNEAKIATIINEHNVKEAEKFYELNRAVFEGLWKVNGWSGHEPKANRCLMGGVEAVIKDPSDFPYNWHFNDTWVTHSDGANESWSRLTSNL